MNTTYFELFIGRFRLLAILFTLFCSFFYVSNSNYADDSIRWANELVNSTGIINTHHLIFNLLSPLYQITSLFLDKLSPGYFLLVYSALWGGIGLIAIDKTLVTLGYLDHKIRAFAVLFCMSTTGFFSYSMVGDVYVPAASSLLLGSYFLINLVQNINSKFYNILLASVFLFSAILHHQAFFIFAAGIFLWSVFLLLRKEQSFRSTALSLSLVPILTGLLSILAYITAYLTSTESSGNIYSFVAGYAESFAAYPDMKSISLTTIPKAIMGFTRATLSLYQLFAIDTLALKVQEIFPYRHVYGSVAIAKAIPYSAAILLNLTALLTGLLILLRIPGLIKSMLQDRIFGQFALFCLLPQMLFFVWWESVSDEFWLWIIPFFTIALSISHKSIFIADKLSRVSIVTLLLLTTLFGFYLPSNQTSSNIDLVNNEFTQSLTPDDVLISFDEIISANRLEILSKEKGFTYFNLFTRAEKGKPLQDVYKQITSYAGIAEKRGGRLIIGPYLSTPPKSYLRLVRNQKGDFETGWKTFYRELEANFSNLEVQKPVYILPNYFESEWDVYN
jgi:hypothetical protein